MFRMRTWQWLVVAIVAAACVVPMSFVVARMFARTADVPGRLRDATEFESGIVSGRQPANSLVLDGFSYRVPARFAGRVRVVTTNDAVTVTGPRAPSGLYRGWIWAQALLLALVPAGLAWALVRLDWRPLLVAVAVAVLSVAVMALGAGLWPGLGETEWIDDGRFKAVEYPRSAVSDVKIGEGWADGGIEWVLLPYKGAIDELAKDRAVSWYGPDGEGHEVRYAVHFRSKELAEGFARVLREPR